VAGELPGLLNDLTCSFVVTPGTQNGRQEEPGVMERLHIPPALRKFNTRLAMLQSSVKYINGASQIATSAQANA
jgi:hypothetical protein